MAIRSYSQVQTNGQTLTIPSSAYDIFISIVGGIGASGGSDTSGPGGSGGSARQGTFQLADFTGITLTSYSPTTSAIQGSGCFDRITGGGSSPDVADGGDGGYATGCSGTGGGGGGASAIYSDTDSKWIIAAGAGGGGGGGSWDFGGGNGGNAGSFVDGAFTAANFSDGATGFSRFFGDGGGGGGGAGGAPGGAGGFPGLDQTSSSIGGNGGGSRYDSSVATLIDESLSSAATSSYVLISYSYTVPEINYFRAIPNPRSDGTYDVELQWDVSDATTVSINQGVGSVSSSGTQTVNTGLSPSNQILTITYTLTASGGGVTDTQSITVAMVDGSVTTNNTSLYNSGPISFSSLRSNFKETASGSISASELIRNTDITNTNPIVPDSTENRTSGPLSNGVPASNLNLHASQFRNTIKYYNLVQSGGVVDLNIAIPSNTVSSFSGWNNNLGKNIVKTFTITGDCDSSSSYYYQTTPPTIGISTQTYSTPGTYTFNLPSSTDITLKIAGGAGGDGGTDGGPPQSVGATGGLGRYAELELSDFTSGTLTLVVGGAGGDGLNSGQTAVPAGGTGGSNGGGTGGDDGPTGSSGGGGGGGGASYVYLDNTLIAVLGGGGGGGGGAQSVDANSVNTPNTTGFAHQGGDAPFVAGTTSAISTSDGGDGVQGSGDAAGSGGGGGGASGGLGGPVGSLNQRTFTFSGSLFGPTIVKYADGGLGGASKYRSDILTLSTQSTYTTSTNGFIEIEYTPAAESFDPHKPAVEFLNSATYNLTIDVQGSINGSNGMDPVPANASSRTGSDTILSNPNGGDAMQINTTTGSITIDLDASARITKGNRFSTSYQNGVAITGTNYTVQGSVNGTTIDGSYQAS